MTIVTPKPTTKSNVVRMSRPRAMAPDDVWKWLEARRCVTAPVTVLCREWGWAKRRGQRQIEKWVLAGKLHRDGKKLTVAPLPAPDDKRSATGNGTRRHLGSFASLRVLIAAAVLAPVAALNMWPRAEQLIAGRMDSAGWAILGFQVLATLLAAQVPFAMGRAKSWPPRLVLGGFAVLLIAGNMVFAVEAIGTVRDNARDHNRTLTATIASLTRQLTQARTDRTALGAVTPVTGNQLLAASMAVTAAKTAREAECGKVGDNCRKREDTLTERQTELNKVEADKAVSDKAADLDKAIADYETQLRKLGPAPVTQDPIAARLSILLFNTVTPERVADLLPPLLSLIAELTNVLGPWIVISGFQPAPLLTPVRQAARPKR